jgi:hypothetical protein
LITEQASDDAITMVVINVQFRGEPVTNRASSLLSFMNRAVLVEGHAVRSDQANRIGTLC